MTGKNGSTKKIESQSKAWVQILATVSDRARNPLVTLTDDCRIVGCNQAFARLTGVADSECRGMPLDAVSRTSSESSAWWEEVRSGGVRTGSLGFDGLVGRAGPIELPFYASNDVLPGVHLLLFRDPAAVDRMNESDPLSRREHEVLELVASGLNNREIGEQLGIASETVKSHIDTTRSKLGAATRAEAVAVAIRLGYLSSVATTVPTLG